MASEKRFAGVLAVIAAATLWGSTGTTQALLPEAREPLVVAAVRLGVGALSLLALARLRRTSFRGLPWRPMICAGIAIAAYNLLFFSAVTLAGVGIGTAIAIGSAPVWVGLFDFARGRPPTPTRAAAQFAAISGAALLALSGAKAEGGVLGIALAALAGASYATYSILTGRMVGRAEPVAIASGTFSAAAILALPVLAIVPLGWVFDPGALLALAFLGVGATGVSYALYTWGLGRVTVATGVTLALAEPLTAWILAVAVVGETVTPATLLGAALVFAGLAIVSLDRDRESTTGGPVPSKPCPDPPTSSEADKFFLARPTAPVVRGDSGARRGGGNFFGRLRSSSASHMPTTTTGGAVRATRRGLATTTKRTEEMNQETITAPKAAAYVREIKKGFRIVPSHRRENADLFERFIDRDNLRDDGQFYSALSIMMSGDGIEELREFDRRIPERKQKNTFHHRALDHIASYIGEDPFENRIKFFERLDYYSGQVSPFSFEAFLLDFLTMLNDESESKDTTTVSNHAVDDERAGLEDWASISHSIAEKARSLITPKAESAQEILDLAKRLVDECGKAEQRERANLAKRRSDIAKRISEIDAGLLSLLPDEPGTGHLEDIDALLSELESARAAADKADSEVESLKDEARMAVDSGDFETQLRLVPLQKEAFGRRESLSVRAQAAREELERSLPVDASAHRSKPEEIKTETDKEKIEVEPTSEAAPERDSPAVRATDEAPSQPKRGIRKQGRTGAGDAIEEPPSPNDKTVAVAPPPDSKERPALGISSGKESFDANQRGTKRDPSDKKQQEDSVPTSKTRVPSQGARPTRGQTEIKSGAKVATPKTGLNDQDSGVKPGARAKILSKALSRFLREGEIVFAWHLARLREDRGETPEIPAAVLWGLLMLRGVRTMADMGERQRSTVMAEMMDSLSKAGDRAAAGRLALAALLRPALFAPSYGARNELRKLPREAATENTARLVETLSDLGYEIEFSEKILADLAGAKTDERLTEVREAMKNWIERARLRKTAHQPTYKIFHEELEPSGVIGRAFNAAMSDTPEAAGIVEEFIGKWDDDRGAQELFVEEAALRGGRPKNSRIDGMALGWFCRNLQEACDLLRDWRNAHKERAATTKDHKSLLRAVGEIRRELDAAADGAESVSTGEPVTGSAPSTSTLASAANAVLRDSLEDIRGLLDGKGALYSLRRVKDMSETPLLRLPGGCQDWTGSADESFDEERTRRDNRMLRSLSNKECIAANYSEAFGQRIKEHAILASREILEILKRDGTANESKMEEYQQMLDEALDSAREKARDQVAGLRQSFATISYLNFESRDEVHDILTQISAISVALSATDGNGDVTLPAASEARVPGIPPDFPELDDVLSEFEKRRSELTDEITGRQKRQLEILTQKGGPLGESAKRILDEMHRLDPVTVEDAVAELSAGRDVSLPERDAHDEFADFFPDFVTRIEESNGEGLTHGRIVQAAKEGGATGPLDFSGLEKTERGRSRQVLSDWRGLENAMKQNRPDPIRRAFGDVLGGLGFTKVNISGDIVLVPGKVRGFSIKCNWIQPDGWFIPPAFGSEADGHYRCAVVRGDLPPQGILREIANEAPDQPWIVMILRRLSVRERRALAQKAHSDARKVLVVDESLLLHLATRGGDPLPALFACALPFGWVQPYVTRAGEIPPEMFFGRQDEVARIAATDGGGCLIYGGRQLGKSALLNKIRSDRHRPLIGELAIYIDIRPVGGAGTPSERIWSDLLHHIREHIEIPPRIEDPNGIVREIEDWLGVDPSRRLLTMFDESDNFLKNEHEHGYPNLQLLKDLMGRTRMRFKAVFAGLHNVRRMAQAPNSPLPHLGEPICIGPMNQTKENRSALRRLATDPMRAAGLDYADPTLALDLLTRMNYYPSLVQIFCRQIVESIGRRVLADPDGPRWALSHKAMFDGEAASKAAEQIRDRFQLTLNLDLRYECIAKSLALHRLDASSGDEKVFSKGESPERLLDLARPFWPHSLDHPGVLDIEELLKEMVDLGVLSEFGENRYGLRSALVAQMLGTREQLESSLLLLGERESEPTYNPREFHSLLRPVLKDERAPLTDRDIKLLFDASKPGTRLVIGHPVIIGSGLGRRIQVAADIIRNSSNTLTTSDRNSLRREIDAIGDKKAVLVVEGEWNAKDAEDLSKMKPVDDGRIIPVWCLERTPDILPDGIKIYRAKPWSEAMLRHWLASENLAPIFDNEKIRRAVMTASGCAPARLGMLLPVLREVETRSEAQIEKRLREWLRSNPVTAEEIGVDVGDLEFLREFSQMREAISSREDMMVQFGTSSDRISKLEELNLIRNHGSADNLPSVTPFGHLLIHEG